MKQREIFRNNKYPPVRVQNNVSIRGLKRTSHISTVTNKAMHPGHISRLAWLNHNEYRPTDPSHQHTFTLFTLLRFLLSHVLDTSPTIA